MKQIYVIHGWARSPTSEPWFSWLEQECLSRKWEIKIPKMPNPENPVIEEWVSELEEVINPEEADEIYLVGHSIGCQAIMRFLVKNNIKVKGVVFVAGWFNLLETAYEEEEEKEIAKPWIITPIDFEKVKVNCQRFLAIFSKNDPCVPISDSEIFKSNLNAEIVVRENEEHFNNTPQINEIITFIE